MMLCGPLTKTKRLIILSAIVTTGIILTGTLFIRIHPNKARQQQHGEIKYNKQDALHRMKRGTTSKDELTVVTDGGRVRGLRHGNSLEFKGIPYAKPPVGNYRWKPPRPCVHDGCWTGTFSATNFGNPCLQFVERKPHGKEDCLVLNVWTPGLDKKRPVLVYIHGGELMYGSGNDGGEHPSPEFVHDLDVVGVTFNYRLNVFGFLALDALADDSATNTSGNYGFMDQIMALKWVKNNIANFGGDPGRVTLIGHSSGGTSEVALLGSPLAKGLFHGAIIMSASALLEKSSSSAAKDNEVFLERLGCNSRSFSEIRKCLYGSRPRALIRKLPWDVYPFWGMPDLTDLPTVGRLNGAIATVDGYVVPEPPLKAMAAGSPHINDVPIIIGTTAQEVDYFPGKDFTNLPSTDFKTYARSKLSGFLETPEMDEVFAMYEGYKFVDPQLTYSTIVSDIRATCPNHVLALNASIGFASPVYRYVVTNWPSKPVKLPLEGSRASPYAFHVWDIQAFFGFPRDLGYVPSDRDRMFMRDLRREFKSFIHTGKVFSCAWSGYPKTTAEFSDYGLQITCAYHKKECEFWLNRGFFRYGWVN